MGRILGRPDVVDLSAGAAVLGTGGGGSPELGLSLLNRILDRGKEIRMISVQEVPDDAVVIHSSNVGSIAPSQGEEGTEDYLNRFLSEEGPLVTGIRTMEEVLGRKIHATVPVELGGYNTPHAAILGALAGVPFVDADTIGRSKPELMMQTYTVHKIPITPMVVTDMRGNCVVVRKVAGFRDAERIARAMAVVGGIATTVRCPIRGAIFRKTTVPGGVSKAMAIGKAWRTARAQHQDPVQAVIQASGGTEFFRGEVHRFEWEDRDGFLWGTIQVRGMDSYGGHELKVWLKNENLLSWLDEKPYVLTPDLICILDEGTGEAITNTQVQDGRRIVAFGIPCDPFWRTKEAFDLVSPQHFGYDLPYVPMEKVLSSRPGK